MRRENQRTPEEIIIDRALLLTLYCATAEHGHLGTKLKAQKLPFLAAVPMFEADEKAFSLEFFRWNHGPMSKAVYDALEDFDALGFVSVSGYELSKPSAEAHQLARAFTDEVLKGNPQNDFCLRRLRSVARKYGEYSSFGLRDLVYDMKFTPLESNRKMTVRETPKTWHFTAALDAAEAVRTLHVPGEWLDTLAVRLNPHNYGSLKRASKQLRELVRA